jgi:solute:Na+ symporter, SSS family
LNVYLAVLIAYSLLLAVAGLLLSRGVHHAGDFLVAGRNLGPGLVFATFLAANIGAGSTVGAASLGYQAGLSAWWWVGSAGIGCLLLGNTLAPRLWLLAQTEGFHSIGDFLEWRYSKAVRILIAAILWIGSLGLLGAQLIALSILLQVTAGVPAWTGAVAGGALMAIYYTAGGLHGSARVNLVQLVILLSGFGLAIPYALDSAGGWAQISRTMASGSMGQRYLNPFGLGGLGILHYVTMLVPSFIISPGLVQKAYAARSPEAARRGITFNALALLIFAAIPPLLGIVARSAVPGLSDPQFAVFRVMTDLLPKWLAILGLAAIFSAEVSTCDAVLSMLTTSFAVDLYRGWWRPQSTDAQLLRVSRWTSVAAGTLGVLVAVVTPSILATLTFFYGLLTVSLFVPVVFGLYSSRPDSRSALISICAAVGTSALVSVIRPATPQADALPVVAGLLVSFLVLFFGPRLMRQRNRRSSSAPASRFG